ncbi:MAG: hypothetical protein ACE141_19050 [Bryobacteraceae bacterium]
MAARTCPLLDAGETSYECGAEPQFYLLCGRRPPSGVFLAYPLAEGPLAGTPLARVVDDLARAKPDLLIVGMELLARTPPDHSVLKWCYARYRAFPSAIDSGHFRF